MYLDTASSASRTLPLLAGALSAVWLLYIGGKAVYNITLHPLAKYPGPKLWAAFWWPDTWSLFRGIHVNDVHALHKKYGRVVRINPETLSFIDGQVWKDVYGFRPGKGQMRKDPRFYNVDKTENLPHNIIVADDARHSRYRRSLAHAFSDQALREQETILNGYFELLMTKLEEQVKGPNKGKIDFVGWYNYTTFDIIGDLAFADSFHALERGRYHPWIAKTFKSIKFIRWFRVGGRYPLIMKTLQTVSKLLPSIRESRATHLRYTGERVEHRLDTDTDRKDFMTYVLRHNDEKGMTREEMISNAAVLIIAGSETTATLLSGATYHLLKNPEKLKRLQDEVRETFSSLDEMTLLSTSKLRYLQAVIEEALRMYPPVADAMYRLTPPEGAEIAGNWVPGNTSVGFSHWSAYRDAGNFAEPDSFAPERWLPDAPEKFANDDKQALQPFSFGPRNCIGKNLAYNEMRSILARVIYTYDMELCSESQGWTDQKTYLIWEKQPLMVQLHPRKA